jgi:hypothetical protein
VIELEGLGDLDHPHQFDLPAKLAVFKDRLLSREFGDQVRLPAFGKVRMRFTSVVSGLRWT